MDAVDSLARRRVSESRDSPHCSGLDPRWSGLSGDDRPHASSPSLPPRTCHAWIQTESSWTDSLPHHPRQTQLVRRESGNHPLLLLYLAVFGAVPVQDSRSKSRSVPTSSHPGRCRPRCMWGAGLLLLRSSSGNRDLWSCGCCHRRVGSIDSSDDSDFPRSERMNS